MDMNNPDIVHAYAEGYRAGYEVGWRQAKQEDVDILLAACDPKETEKADPGFGDDY